MRRCFDASAHANPPARSVSSKPCSVRRSRGLRSHAMSFEKSRPVVARGRSGQATLEAALMMPVLLTGFLLLLQPCILLYDRAVMQAAASHACRLAETSLASEREVAAFVERRLSSIPEADAFHTGAWEVHVQGGEGSERVSVEIAHTVTPLPVVGAFVRALGSGGRYRQEVSCSASPHDEWLTASEEGPDPEAWMRRWEERA